MTNRGVEIYYGDVAVGAKESFDVSAENIEFDTVDQLKGNNLNFPNYRNPCELYSVILDGEGLPFPEDAENKNIGVISKYVSDEWDNNALFDPVEITLTSDELYTSQGFTLTFDTYNNIYAKTVSIHWWRDADGVLVDLGEKYFYPDSAVYFCHNKVEKFNRVKITLWDVNMPQNRLRLRAIEYGYGAVFHGDELRGARVIQELDPISSAISIDTVDFTLDSKNNNVEYSFQTRQPLSIFFNGKLRATTFVSKSKRIAKRMWSVQTEDYIGLLDIVNFSGGIYTDVDAIGLLESIFNTAKVPFDISEELQGVKLSGYIPYTTCREALKQVAFAVQAVVDTSESDVVKVYKLGDELKQTIGRDRIMQGQTFSDADTVTAVEMSAHAYIPTTEQITAYDAKESGIGENIFVRFSEPLHTLTASQGLTIVKSGSNYALINVTSNSATLTGRKYDHSVFIKRINNPLVTANELEKVISINDATLVSAGNIDKVLASCYNWLARTRTINTRIVEKKTDLPVSVGDNIAIATEYMGELEGRLVSARYNLNGGILVKEAVIK